MVFSDWSSDLCSSDLSLGVVLLRVHAGGPEVADQVPGAAGAVLGAGLLGTLTLDRDRALVEHLERAPRRAVAGDRIRGEPLAVGVEVEVDAGVLTAAKVGELDAVASRPLALVLGQRRDLVRALAGGVGRGGVFA